ncbi:MAG TPA: hypothetical protein VHD36_05605 [Pirellulales bacterium]|nr:hypothetical protein [Pirellulales bacterium]
MSNRGLCANDGVRADLHARLYDGAIQHHAPPLELSKLVDNGLRVNNALPIQGQLGSQLLTLLRIAGGENSGHAGMRCLTDRTLDGYFGNRLSPQPTVIIVYAAHSHFGETGGVDNLGGMVSRTDNDDLAHIYLGVPFILARLLPRPASAADQS